MSDILESIKARTKLWQETRKPAHLLDIKNGDDFSSLFDSSPLSERNARECWWNENPPFYACGILVMWHPMLYAQLSDTALDTCVRSLFEGFEIEEAFLWQDALTRWVYLSRNDPNRDDDTEEAADAPYVDTRYVERLTFQNGTLSFECISAS